MNFSPFAGNALTRFLKRFCASAIGLHGCKLLGTGCRINEFFHWSTHIVAGILLISGIFSNAALASSVHEDNGKASLAVQSSTLAPETSEYNEKSASNLSASATVESSNAEPVISVRALSDEDYLEGDTVEFEIKTADDVSVGSQLMIRVEIRHTGDYFGGAATPRTVMVALPAMATKTENLAIATFADAVDEANGSVTATILDGTGYSPASASDTEPDYTDTATVLDNDGMNLPIVTISAVEDSVSEGESAGFKVSLPDGQTNGTGAALSEGIEISQKGDFLMNAEGDRPALTIPTMVSESSIHMEPTRSADGIDEEDGQIIATVKSGSNFSVGVDYRESVTVMDVDESPTITLASDMVSVSEGDGTLSFEVQLSAASEKTVTVDFSISPISASMPADFSLNSASWITGSGSDWRLEFAAGVRSRTIVFTIVDDTNPELSADETFRLTFTAPVNASFARGVDSITATGAIIDNEPDDRPTVSVAVKDVTERDRNGRYVVDEIANGSFEITLSINPVPDPGKTVVVNNLKAANTVGKYSVTENFLPVTFDNSSASVDLTVKVLDNNRYDGWGTITVGFKDTNNYKSSQTTGENNIPVTVRDDEKAPVTVTATAQAVTKGQEIVVALTASPVPAAGEMLDIDFSVSETGTLIGFFTAGNYDPKSIILDNANPSKTFTITTNSPTTAGNGEVSVALKRGDGYEPAAANPLRVAINDIVTVTAVVSAEVPERAFEGDSFGILIRSNEAPGAGNFFTIDLTVTETGTARGFLPRDISTSVTLMGMQRSAILTVDTTVVDPGTENGEITLTLGSGHNYGVDSTNAGIYAIPILDSANDTRPTVSIEAPETVDENDSDGMFSVTLRSAPPPTQAIRINRATFTVADKEGSYLGVQPTGDITIGRDGVGTVVVVLAADNDTYDGWGAITLKLLNGPNHRVGEHPATKIDRDVVIVDDDPSPVSVSLTAPDTVSEGDSFNVVLTANPNLGASETLALDFSVMETGTVTGFFNADDYEVENDDTPGTIVITGSSSGRSVSVAIRTQEVNYKPGSGQLTVILKRGNGYEVVSDRGTRLPMISQDITINDDDTSPLVFVSAVKGAIGEGENAEFNVTANHIPTSAEPVIVSFRVSQSGDYIALSAPSSIALTASRITGKVSIATDDDFIKEDDGMITLTLTGATSGYMVSEGNSATVTVSSDDSDPDQTATRYSVAGQVITKIILNQVSDTPATIRAGPVFPPTVSISALAVSVEEGEPAVFSLTLTEPVEEDLTIGVDLTQSGEFLAGSLSRLIVLEAGRTEVAFNVETEDDDFAENDGSITATSRKGRNYLVGTDRSASVAVTDAQDREARRSIVAGASIAVISEMAGSIGARSLDTAAQRVTSAFSESREPEFKLGGNVTLTDFVKAGGRVMNDGIESWQKVLGDTSFEFGLFPEEDSFSLANVWGFGDFRDLSAGAGSNGKLDGDVFTGQLGFDTRIGDRMTAGLAAAVSRAELDYESGIDAALSYRIETAGMHPYFGLETPSGNRLRINTGYGLGGIELNQDGYETEFLDSSYFNFGISGNRLLYSSDSLLFGGNSDLTLEGGSWMTRQFLSSDGNLLDNMRTDARHLRISTVSTHRRELGSGLTVSPSVSMGVREDGKRGDSFLGMEIGGGIGFANPHGYEITTKGETLFAGIGQIREWGLSGNLTYDAGSDGLGMLLDVTPEWRRNMLIAEKALWSDNVLVRNFDSSMHARGARIKAEIGYGLAIWEDMGTLNPYGGLLLSELQNDRYNLGTRLNLGSNIRFGLEGLQTIEDDGASEKEVKLEGSIEW